MATFVCFHIGRTNLSTIFMLPDNYTTSCVPCQMVPSAATYSYVQGRCPISAPQLKGNREILI